MSRLMGQVRVAYVLGPAGHKIMPSDSMDAPGKAFRLYCWCLKKLFQPDKTIRSCGSWVCIPGCSPAEYKAPLVLLRS